MSRLVALEAVCTLGNPPSAVVKPGAVYGTLTVLPAKCSVGGQTQTATPSPVE